MTLKNKSNSLFPSTDRLSYSSYLLPVLLIVAVTVVKYYAFSAVGYPVPYIFYAIITFLCWLYSGWRAAIVALITAVFAATLIYLFPEIVSSVPNQSLSIYSILVVTLIWLGLLAQAHQRGKKILQENTDKFRFLADSVPGMVWTADSKLKANYYNSEWYKFTGESSVEGIRSVVWSLIHPDDLRNVKEAYEKAREDGEPFEVEYRLKDKEGKYRWYLNKTKVLREANGTVKLWIGTSVDIEMQKQNLELTQRNEKHFRFLADNAPIIIWETDRDGVLHYLSKQWEVFSGQTIENSLGSLWRKYLHSEDAEQQKAVYETCFRERKIYTTKFRLRRRDGEHRWFLSVGHPIFEGNIGYLGSLTDITEEELATRQSNLELKKMDEFVSIASHELKTPITSLKLYLQLLDKSQVGGSNKFISRGLEQVKRLERLTSDLLDVSKISAGKLVYNTSDFDFSELISEAVEQAQHMGIKHQLIINNNVSVPFSGDKFRLEQVFANIISNAVKYSPDADRIIINSRLEGNYLVVSVQDFGIGIERSDLSKIFQRFYRVDATAMKYEGLGLGLFIVSEILIRHKGDFWIESELGKGSVFYFKLPVAAATRSVYADDDSSYSDNSISIRFDHATAILEVDWKGFQDMDSVKIGCLKMYDLLKKNKCSLILNDNTHVSGTSDASEWVGKIWFPMMEEAGLRYFAWVYSAVMFNNISAEKAIDLKQGNVVTQFFTSAEDAREWLRSKKQHLNE